MPQRFYLHEACTRNQLLMVRTLLSHGADVKAENTEGKTPFEVAIECGHTEICRELERHTSVQERSGRRNREGSDQSAEDGSSEEEGEGLLEHVRAELARDEEQVDESCFGNVLVHLDLKGCPPRVDYFDGVFGLLAAFPGVKGVLLELDDMFPYEGALRCTRNERAYSKEELRRIIRSARHHGLKVVPLIQCFGHLEFVLKRA